MPSADTNMVFNINIVLQSGKAFVGALFPNTGCLNWFVRQHTDLVYKINSIYQSTKALVGVIFQKFMKKAKNEAISVFYGNIFVTYIK